MIRFAYEETIAVTPEAVFAVMADVARFDEWLDMDGRPTQPGPVGVGSRFESTGRMGPLGVRGSGEVTSYEPAKAFGFRMTAPGAFDFTIDLRLQPHAAGTWLQPSPGTRPTCRRARSSTRR